MVRSTQPDIGIRYQYQYSLAFLHKKPFDSLPLLRYNWLTASAPNFLLSNNPPVRPHSLTYDPSHLSHQLGTTHLRTETSQWPTRITGEMLMKDGVTRLLRVRLLLMHRLALRLVEGSSQVGGAGAGALCEVTETTTVAITVEGMLRSFGSACALG